MVIWVWRRLTRLRAVRAAEGIRKHRVHGRVGAGLGAAGEAGLALDSWCRCRSGPWEAVGQHFLVIRVIRFRKWREDGQEERNTFGIVSRGQAFSLSLFVTLTLRAPGGAHPGLTSFPQQPVAPGSLPKESKVVCTQVPAKKPVIDWKGATVMVRSVPSAMPSIVVLIKIMELK